MSRPNEAVSAMTDDEYTKRVLGMSTAHFDEHERLIAEAADRAERTGHALDEHWRHQSVLWAQGLLERYGRVTVGCGTAGRHLVGGLGNFWSDANGAVTDHDAARDAAEAIIPQLGIHDPADTGSQPATYEPRHHHPKTGEPPHQSQPSASPAPTSSESDISSPLSERGGEGLQRK